MISQIYISEYVRVQGGGRCYAAALLPDHKIGILKKENDYRVLAAADFLSICIYGNDIMFRVNCNLIFLSVMPQKICSRKNIRI